MYNTDDYDRWMSRLDNECVARGVLHTLQSPDTMVSHGGLCIELSHSMAFSPPWLRL